MEDFKSWIGSEYFKERVLNHISGLDSDWTENTVQITPNKVENVAWSSILDHYSHPCGCSFTLPVRAQLLTRGEQSWIVDALIKVEELGSTDGPNYPVTGNRVIKEKGPSTNPQLPQTVEETQASIDSLKAQIKEAKKNLELAERRKLLEQIRDRQKSVYADCKGRQFDHDDHRLTS